MRYGSLSHFCIACSRLGVLLARRDQYATCEQAVDDRGTECGKPAFGCQHEREDVPTWVCAEHAEKWPSQS